MNKSFLNFTVEPRGALYRDLIRHAVVDCNIALLVVQTMPLEQRGQEVLTRLAAFLIEKVESSEWPGTKLLNRTGWVFRYRFEPESAEILAGAADALYDWLQPNLPEDICLLRADGTPWLVSIAHEKDGYLELSQEEKARLFDALPAFRSLIEDTSNGSPCGMENGEAVMIQSELEPLESEVLKWFLAGEHAVLGTLREQLASACVLSRTLTDHGFLLKLSVPAGTTKLHEQFHVKSDFCLGDVTAATDSLEHDVGFLLCITDGILDLLEGYTYDESWPVKVTNFALEYVTGIYRDLAELSRQWETENSHN